MTVISKMKSSLGFTIIEAMIAVSIAAITAAFVIPAYDSFKVKSRIASSAEQFSGVLATARNLAATRQRSVFLTRTADTTGEYYTLRLNSNTNTVVESQFVNRADSNVVITRTPAITELKIDPSGLVSRTDTNAALDWVILFCDSSVRSEKGRTVKLNRMGRISSVENTVTTTCNP